MKSKIMMICFFLLGLVFAVDAQMIAVLQGKIQNWNNDGYLLTRGTEPKFDTLNVAADGSFRHEFQLDGPLEKKLHLDYIKEGHTSFGYYLIPGKTTFMDIVLRETSGGLKPAPVYRGENQKVCEYLYRSGSPNFGFKPDFFRPDSSVISFKEYTQQLAGYQQELRDLLKDAPREFAAEKSTFVDNLSYQLTFAYAPGAKRRGYDAADDADFMAYFNSIDLNDANTTLLAVQWMNFYLERHLLAGIENKDILFYKTLREKISNQKVINHLADGRMTGYFARGEEDSLPQIFAEYKKTSTNPESLAKFQAMYDRAAVLFPGAQAVDFDMQDVNGKTLWLSDIIGKGKVMYVDFWATWCEGCCMEIPYVEKLVEKYKDSPDIEFVSISLDKDLKKWHKKLEKDRPGWAQYVIPANFNSKFAKEYNIRAIPRFMLFDREGRIISTNSPCPSDKDIETYLERWCQ